MLTDLLLSPEMSIEGQVESIIRIVDSFKFSFERGIMKLGNVLSDMLVLKEWVISGARPSFRVASSGNYRRRGRAIRQASRCIGAENV